MVLISDSLSADSLTGPRPAGQPARGPGQGRRGGRAPGPLAWLCVSCGGAASPASGALFSRPPGPPPRPNLLAVVGSPPPAPPPFFLFKGGPRCSPPQRPLPACPSLPGCVVPGILTPGGPSWGQKNSPVPSGRSPPPPAGWPLSHRFHRSRLRFPAPSPSLPSLILGPVQLEARPAPRSASLPPCL